MNILIAQPLLEKQLVQLKQEIESHPEVDVVIFPEGYINGNLELASTLAKDYSKIIISGHKKPKDRALIIDREGKILLDRAKYDKSTLTETEETIIGFMLCDEIVIQGMCDMEQTPIDFIVHPIGVGMFSEDQCVQWIEEAKNIAVEYKTMVIGTSHGDGYYKDSRLSIPIAYCIDKEGNEVFVSKNDTRTRILNINTKQVITI